MRLGTTVVWTMSKMNVVESFKLDHSASPGGGLKFGKKMKFDCSELDICGQRFLKNYKAKFLET